jgi:hypothetical protein
MILRVGIPELPTAAVRLRVDRWLVASGERVEFGDPIVRLVVDVRHALPHITDAATIVSLSTQDDRGSVGAPKEKPDDARIDLLAADSGWLRRQLVIEGCDVAPTGVLGLVSTIVDEPVGDGLEDTLPFRSSAELLDDAEDFS